MAKVSIIYVHWAMNGERSAIMRNSIMSLIESIDTQANEIIVIDNGTNLEDSRFLLDLTQGSKIAAYLRYRKNMHFAYARNDGLRLATGDYLAISDNDIIFSKGWLNECVKFLEDHPGNYLTTPILPDPMNQLPKREFGELDGWKLNSRAGSNMFLMRRSDFRRIGDFPIHHIAGSHYVDMYREQDYLMACMPKPKAYDAGLRKGYNIKLKLPTDLTL